MVGSPAFVFFFLFFFMSHARDGFFSPFFPYAKGTKNKRTEALFDGWGVYIGFVLRGVEGAAPYQRNINRFLRILQNETAHGWELGPNRGDGTVRRNRTVETV